MKQLLVGCALIIVLGVVGFLYRYGVENPTGLFSPGSANQGSSGACTQEAKVCPDGSAVGRTGPNCSFALCSPPNVALISASTTISFVLPAGYKPNTLSSNDPAYLASYVQSFVSPQASSTSSSSAIDIYDYPIGVGETPSQVMLSHTYFSPSGAQATSTNPFQNVVEGSNTFYAVLIGASGGQVQNSYYLYEPQNVFRFDITERGVQNATDPHLNPNTLPQHEAFEQMLATLQVGT